MSEFYGAVQIAQFERELLDWARGERSWTNLGPNPPYTPDVIAIMDTQEVAKRAYAIMALVALEERHDRQNIIDIPESLINNLNKYVQPTEAWQYDRESLIATILDEFRHKEIKS